MDAAVISQGTLPNGMRWVTAHDSGAKTASFQLLTAAGSRMEPVGKKGMAHLIEHLFFDGTTYTKGPDLMARLSKFGGQPNAYTTNDVVVYHCKMRGEYVQLMAEWFSEILYHSIFTDEDIEREKEVVLQEVAMRTGSPLSNLTAVVLPQHAWRNTPAAEPVGGNEEDIRSITRDDVLSFVAQMYRPEHIVLSLAGDLPPTEEIEEMLHHHFSYSVVSTPTPVTPLADAIHQEKAVNYSLTTGGDEAVVAISFPYLTQEMELVAEVLAVILFDTMNSRLFVKLRTELGLVYSISSLSMQLRDVGLFGFFFTLDSKGDAVVKAVEASFTVLQEIVDEGVKEEELQQALTYLKEQRLLALEDSSTLAAYCGKELLLKGKVKPYSSSLENLGREEVKRQATLLFDTSRLNLAVFA